VESETFGVSWKSVTTCRSRVDPGNGLNNVALGNLIIEKENTKLKGATRRILQNHYEIHNLGKVVEDMNIESVG
jgi:hypothetical protein